MRRKRGGREQEEREGGKKGVTVKSPVTKSSTINFYAGVPQS